MTLLDPIQIYPNIPITRNSHGRMRVIKNPSLPVLTACDRHVPERVVMQLQAQLRDKSAGCRPRDDEDNDGPSITGPEHRGPPKHVAGLSGRGSGWHWPAHDGRRPEARTGNVRLVSTANVRLER